MSYLGNKPSDVFPTSFTVTNATVEGAFTSQGIDDNATSTAITIDSSQGVTLSSNGDATQLKIKRASASQDNGLSLVDQVGTAQAYFNLEGTATNNLQIASTAVIQFFSGSTLGNPPTNERFQIGTNGNLYSTSNDGSLANFTLRNGSSSDSVDFQQCRSSSNALKFVIENDGDVKNENNSYGAVSDQKLKENIIDAPSQWDDIKAVQVRKYSLIADDVDTPNLLGVIAQELEASGMNGLVGQSADTDEDGNELGTVTKNVKYSILYMKAVKALQEAMTRIETLETAKTDLEARITALENA